MRDAKSKKRDAECAATLLWPGALRHRASCIAHGALLLVHCVLCLLLAGCANIGSPEGGPRDYTPPRVLRTSPEMGAVNVTSNKVEITFDEIVNIKDQQKKVIVSPVQHDPPLIRALGKKITVELRDTLLPGTTYVIDFSNAIEDNNEGNPLDGYAFTFSTGPEIDSLRVSGIVLRASDLEPMQHVLVGLHSNLSDTAFSRLPFERVTRTNDLGQFTVMGLKPGRYHAFALNDADGDYRMARTEDIAFLDEVLIPTTATFTSQDTTFTFDHRVDTVVQAEHTRYLPDGVLLTMFNEGYEQLYLRKASRPSASKLLVQFGAAIDTLPELRLLQPQLARSDWNRLERTARGDSLVYWLTDSTLIKADTLMVQMRYQGVDSTERIVWHTDTVRFGYRKPRYQVKLEEEEQKEREKLQGELQHLRDQLAAGKPVEEADIRDLEKQLEVPVPKLKLTAVKSGTLEVTDTIKLKVDAPIAAIAPGGFHIEMKRDTLWVPMAGVPEPQPASEYDLFTYSLPMALTPDSTYRLTVDSLAMTSVYGLGNDPLTVELKVRALEEYANLTLRVNVRDSAFVELLDGTGKVQRTVPVQGGVAALPNVLPGAYYARLTLDSNGNGRWDTGNYAQHLQPEEVYYYPKTLKLRRNWDVEQQWNIYETALDLQKPEAIRKNKPEKRKNALEPDKKKKKPGQNGEEDEEEEDEFNSQSFGRDTYSGNKYRDFQNQRR
ncbi:MAG: Ig-like domain-containing protein [Muribaculaceae bacterium]|nr:Ig-like domain-containing protein [Muribaculaceae bacterium]